MFTFFKKKTVNEETLQTAHFKIKKMHCASCAMNIDGALEDLPGVQSADTNYAQALTTIRFNAHQVNPAQLQRTIEELGYEVAK